MKKCKKKNCERDWDRKDIGDAVYELKGLFDRL